jgi:RNA polymerase sigma-70 factor, ECF subfamily
LSVADTHRSIEAVWKMEAAKLIGALSRVVRDVGLAEDLAQDALVSALEQWPEQGMPRNPGAWLMTAAKHRAIDRLRRVKLLDRKHQELGQVMQARELEMPDFENAIDAGPGDDVLRLMLTACHPVLAPDARVALTLRMLGGLTTDEIARAFLASEPTIAQRIVRAKRTLAEERVPFEIPDRSQLGERLASVLSVLYLIFNEGYSASSGDHWMRPALCEEAMRLGRMLAELAPGEPEVHGLIALMEIQASRFHARTGPSGEPVLLTDQNRARWDHLLIQRGLAALERGEALGGRRGPYVLQATIAACHARARTAEETDWGRIAELYTELVAESPSPIAELARAVAVGMANGPAAGLELVDALATNPDLRNYHRLPSVRADLLFKLGRFGEALLEFERAAALATNAQERQMLQDGVQACRLRLINNSDEV